MMRYLLPILLLVTTSLLPAQISAEPVLPAPQDPGLRALALNPMTMPPETLTKHLSRSRLVAPNNSAERQHFADTLRTLQPPRTTYDNATTRTVQIDAHRGIFRTELYDRPVNHWVDGAGWQPMVATTIPARNPHSDDRSIELNAHRFSIRFSSYTTVHNGVELSMGGGIREPLKFGHSLAFFYQRADGESDRQPITTGEVSSNLNGVIYKLNELDGTLRYTVDSGGLKQLFVLHQPPETATPSLDEFLVLEEEMVLPSGVKLVYDAVNGALRIQDDKQRTFAILPRPVAFEDHTGSPVGTHAVVHGEYRYHQRGQQVTLQVLFPAPWFTDPLRNYPVTVDPTVLLSDAHWGWIANNGTQTSGSQFVYQAEHTPLAVGYTRIDTTGIPANAVIQDVSLTQSFANFVGAGAIDVVNPFMDPVSDPGLAVWNDVLSQTPIVTLTPGLEWATSLGQTGVNSFESQYWKGMFVLAYRPTGDQPIYAYAVKPAKLTVTYQHTGVLKTCTNDGCNESTGMPGCGGCACESCVCGLDPYCCEVEWDSVCASACQSDCDGCGCPCAQDGCVATGDLGCDGCDCEDCVCALDPYCCSVAWDGACVAECQNDCGGCGCGGPPCPEYGEPCEGSDADACQEGGLKYCTWDSTSTYCGDGPAGVWLVQPPSGTTAMDHSGNGNQGTLYNTTWDQSIGAYYFNGVNSYVNVPGSASFEAPHGYTLEAWIRPSVDGDYWTGIAGQVGSGGFRSYQMWLGQSNAATGFIQHAYGCPTNTSHVGNGYTTIHDGSTWSHVVVTMGANGDKSTYINGILVDSAASCGANVGTTATQPFRIGSNLDGSATNYFKGWIRNVALYSYPLSATEIIGHYTNGKLPNEYLNLELCDLLDNDCDGQIDEGYLSCGASSGCVAKATPGCDGCPCEACVCQFDPYCCTTSWDGACVSECKGECGGCGCACDSPTDTDSCTDGSQSCSADGLSATPCANRGPLMVWNYDDGTGATAYDHSGYGNIGTNMQSAAWTTTGKFLGALNLAGNNGYTVSNLDIPESNFTMSAWFKTTTDGGIFSVNAGNDFGSGGSDRHLYISGGRLAYQIWPGATSQCTGLGPIVNDGSWHHGAILCKTGNACKLYVDGNLVCSSTAADSQSGFNWQDRFTVGYSSASGYFSGEIDQVVIHDRPLGSWEVQRLASVGVHTAVEGVNAELCDDIDNDCDGLVDEGFDKSGCSAGTGSCAATGIKSCSANKLTTVCNISDGKPIGTACDDANPCTHTDGCSGGPTSSCTGIGFVCNDGLTCTNDVCNGDGTCSFAVIGGSCLIGGSCFANGSVNPTNPCQGCNSVANPNAWTNKSNGAACNDGNPCTYSDMCNVGTCGGTSYTCNDGLACTADVCNGNNTCSFPTLLNYCKIGGVCWSTGDTNPANPCQRCQSAATNTDWSPEANGAACDDGNACTAVGTCLGGSCDSGPVISCDDGNSCTDDSCDPATGCVHTDNVNVLGPCSAGVLGVCTQGVSRCSDGAPYCMPDVPGFGTLTSVTVPAGLIRRETGLVQSGGQLITSNGKYLFNLAYGIGGTSYNGWVLRVFDPKNAFALVTEKTIPGTSFYTDGIVADANYVYAIEWGSPNRVYKINWNTTTPYAAQIGEILQNNPYYQISGQYDWVNDKFWIGSLYTSNIQRYSRPWVPTATGGWEDDLVAAGPVVGTGVVATDGMYLYVKRWGTYPGDDSIQRIGTGFYGTNKGGYYGKISPPTANSLSMTYHSDGYLYNPTGATTTLQRVRVTGAAYELCDSVDNDCDGQFDEDFVLGASCDGSDNDLCADGQTACKNDGLGTICDENNLVTYFRFDETAAGVANDSSGNGHSGTAVNTTWSVQSQVGAGSISFDGTGYVEFATTGITAKTGTIALWLKPGDWSTNPANKQGVFQTNSAVDSANWLSLFKSDDGLFYFRIGSVDGCCGNDLAFNPTTYLTDDQWTHLAFTWDYNSDSMKIFVNGAQIASRTNIQWSAPPIDPLARLGMGHNAHLVGNVDDAAFFGRALSNAEIAEIANTGVPVDGANLEICDGLDNDCDGLVDNGFNVGSGCVKGVVPCANTGAMVCTADGLSSVCSVSGKDAGSGCNDGNACTKDDVCNGGDNSSCGGTAYVCNDGVVCTTDACNGDGTCTFITTPGTCNIGGVCVADNTTNPDNPCQYCDASTNNSGWTNKTNGSACDGDSNGCTVNDTCLGGLCQMGSAAVCNDGKNCTTDVCVSLTNSSYTCEYTLNNSSCLIAGECFAENQSNPANSCQHCFPVLSPHAWSNKPDGTMCNNDNNGCTADSCQGGGCTVGPTANCSDGKSCTQDLCNSLSSLFYMCTNPVIAGNCLVSGECYTNNQMNPASACQQCLTASSAVSFSPATILGTVCDGADVDSCSDGVILCNPDGATTSCSDGAQTVLLFEEGTGTTTLDLSGNNNTGHLVGNAAWTVGKNSSHAVSFPGNDAVSAVRIPGDNIQGTQFTFAAWVAPMLVDGRYIVSRTTTASDNGFAIGTSGELFLAGNSYGPGAILTANSWAHIAATYDGTKLTVYKNGAFVKAVTVNIPLLQWASDLWLGQEQDTNNGGFDAAVAFMGRMDSVVWLPYALSTSKVVDLMNNGIGSVHLNLELCDGLDNDCKNGPDDPFTTLGDACDGADPDACPDGLTVCAINGLSAVCENEQVLYLQMNDNSGEQAKDSSSYGNHASLTGSTWTTGYSGSGLLFDGSSWGTVGNTPSTQITTPELTLAAWVKWDGTTGSNIILNKENSYAIRVNNGTFECAVETTTAGAWFWSGTGTVPANTWVHVTCTLGSGGQLRTYVNGVLKTTSAYIGGAIQTTIHPLYIGRNNVGSYFHGKLDDIAVYPRALTTSQINTLATVGPTAAQNFEYCNNFDDDCNGLVDEGYSIGTACSVGIGTCSESGTTQCTADKLSATCSVTGKPSGSVCNDGNVCTTNDVCSGGTDSSCAGTAYTCDDGHSCTNDLCNGDGTCSITINPGSCFVGNVCFAHGAPNPDNACQFCDSGTSPSGWSNKSDGTVCDNDANGCTLDTCQDGGCVVGPAPVCDDAYPCTTDTCSSTGAFSFTCANLISPTTCLIDGVCYDALAVNPGSACQVCAPGTSGTNWSNVANSTPCNADGNGCTLDACQGGACVTGLPPNCDDSISCTIDSCNSEGPNSHSCVHQTTPGTCLIEGVCYLHGDINNTNSCEQCAPASATSWSPGPNGTLCDADGNGCSSDQCTSGTCVVGPAVNCDDGKPCTTDQCISTGPTDHSCTAVLDAGHCLINDVCYASGDVNPESLCEQCDPLNSTQWSISTDIGTPCDGPDTDGCPNGLLVCAFDGINTECGTESVINIAEICNGVDDDCDGETDEDYAPVSCGIGVCAATSACVGGIEQPCLVGPPASDDTDCNLADDDCDGATDEDYSDGIDCTVDVCVGGITLVTPDHSACDDNEPCTDDFCAALTPLAGGCSSVAADNNTPDATLADTNPCTDLVCLGGTSQNIANDSNIPDDAVPCTTDYCTAGVAFHTIDPAHCYIEGVCYESFASDPTNGCSVCTPTQSQTQWSNTLYENNLTGGIGNLTSGTLAGSLEFITTEDRFVSPPTSVWFGAAATGNYSTGTKETGTLSLPAMYLSNDALHMLRFYLFLDTEKFTAAPLYDVLWVRVVTDPAGAASTTSVWESSTTLGGTTNGAWQKINLDLSPFAGQTVQVIFEFDSGDGSWNDYEGAYLDNIEITTACCTTNADCDDGEGCTTDLCDSSSGTNLCTYEDLCSDDCIPTPTNVVVLVDRSASMADIESGDLVTKWDSVQNAVSDAVSEHEQLLNMGLMVFPADVPDATGCEVNTTLDVGLHATAWQVQQYLSTQSPTGGSTPITAVLTNAAAVLQSAALGGVDIVVLVTDGTEECGGDPVAAVTTLKDNGIETLVIGIGSTADTNLLNQVAIAGGRPVPAEMGDPYYHSAPNWADLVGKLDMVLDLAAAEKCDGMDNDCDGEIDENVMAVACNTNCPGIGERICSNGTWSVCSVIPQDEVCNGIDDDCDGQTDEDWAPDQAGNSIGDPCAQGVGECETAGTFGCDTTTPTGPLVCSAVPSLPEVETCDNLDNDCDGVIDNDVVQTCATACGTGQEICVAGSWENCDAPPILPEECNNLDDDCDGETDNDPLGLPLEQPCATACGTGDELCIAGTWIGCTAPPVLSEICNNIDDDCDGLVDEASDGAALTQSCYSGDINLIGIGICVAGNQTCQGGAWSACIDQVLPTVETCNGFDDDCNGTTDLDLLGIPLSDFCYPAETGLGIGPCVAGIVSCADDTEGECIGAVTPSLETCNGIDDDCDGSTDENPGQICKTQPGCLNGLCKCKKNFAGIYKCFLD